MKKCVIFLLGVVIVCTGISAQQREFFNQQNFNGISTIEKLQQQHKDFAVVAFLSSECPISNKLMKPFADLTKQYQQHVSFVLVFPGKFERKNRVEKYCKLHQIEPFREQIILDRELRLVHAFNATITPEFFLINKKNELLYSGSFDDRFVEIGVQKSFAEKHYLLEAIEAAVSGKDIVHKKTRAVGCFINKE